MAKKFAYIKGFHKIFKVSNNAYDITSLNATFNDSINANTIVFLVADAQDNNVKVGSTTLLTGNTFIWNRGTIFSNIKYNGTQDNDLRVIKENGYNRLAANDNTPINFRDTNTISLSAVKNNGVLDVTASLSGALGLFNGALTHSLLDIPVNGKNSSKSIKPSTIGLTADAFSANSEDDAAVKISYNGSADRVDWFDNTEVLTQEYSQPDTTQKKFVYVNGLTTYFSSTDDGYEVEAAFRSLISKDSIVFITCNAKDADVSSKFYVGAKYIWTHNTLFPCKTWGNILVSADGSTDPMNWETVFDSSTADSDSLVFIGGQGIKLDVKSLSNGVKGVEMSVKTMPETETKTIEVTSPISKSETDTTITLSLSPWVNI